MYVHVHTREEGKNNIKEGDPHGSRAPVVAWGTVKNQASVQGPVCCPVWHPLGSHLRASPGLEPLVGWGLCNLRASTSVPGCLAQPHTWPLGGGGGGLGAPFLSCRPMCRPLPAAVAAWVA